MIRTTRDGYEISVQPHHYTQFGQNVESALWEIRDSRQSGAVVASGQADDEQAALADAQDQLALLRDR